MMKAGTLRARRRAETSIFKAYFLKKHVCSRSTAELRPREHHHRIRLAERISAQYINKKVFFSFISSDIFVVDGRTNINHGTWLARISRNIRSARCLVNIFLFWENTFRKLLFLPRRAWKVPVLCTFKSCIIISKVRLRKTKSRPVIGRPGLGLAWPDP